ncbi:MAG: hypothetical protein HY273_14185 [Gammaproteobacteria bacterium]|nr:hypothetical protein [Gammaproteobacteria bacterium]
MRHPKLLSFTLWFIAVVQIVLGLAFLFAPDATGRLLGLAPAPDWTRWMFGMMAARFLGFGYGMLLAARDPYGSVPWIKAMIGIQTIDWVVTLYYVSAGAVTLTQVSTASFLPVMFIMVLLSNFPQQNKAGAAT